jgi:hypothetical protein
MLRMEFARMSAQFDVLAYTVSAFVFRVPTLEDATFMLAPTAAGLRAVRERARTCLATAVL